MDYYDKYYLQVINRSETKIIKKIGFTMDDNWENCKLMIDTNEISIPIVKMQIYYTQHKSDGSSKKYYQKAHTIIRCPCSHRCKCTIYEDDIQSRLNSKNNNEYINITDEVLIAYSKSLTPNNKLEICKCNYDINAEIVYDKSNIIKCLACGDDHVEAEIKNNKCIIICESCKKTTEQTELK